MLDQHDNLIKSSSVPHDLRYILVTALVQNDNNSYLWSVQTDDGRSVGSPPKSNRLSHSLSQPPPENLVAIGLTVLELSCTHTKKNAMKTYANANSLLLEQRTSFWFASSFSIFISFSLSREFFSLCLTTFEESGGNDCKIIFSLSHNLLFCFVLCLV